MTLTFAETHNMISYLTKSYASEGFNQILDFLNGSSIKYALTVNPNIYVSCIKQFWTTIAVKKVNAVIRLQSLVDKKKVVVMEATIREALHLDDEEGVKCMPNEEIFAELTRMGYEKPSTKLTFYKAFFSSQCKFLIHTILQCMSAKRTSWNEFSSSMASAVICLSSGRKFNFSRRCDENVEEVNAGDIAEGDVTAAHGEVPTADEEPSIPSPTPPTPPSQPSQDIPLTSQGRMIAEMDQDTNVVLEDDKEVADEAKEGAEDAKVDDSNDIQGMTTKSQAKIYKIDLDHTNKVLSMQEDETEPAKVQDVVDVVTTAKLITKVVTATITVAPSRRRNGVVIKDPEEESTTSTMIPVETKSKDKAINHVKKKAKEDHAVKRYQLLKRKPQTEAQARKNMMVYLKNVAGFKMDYFKGMSYDDIRLIFEAKFNSDVAFLLNTKEWIEEDENIALKRLNETLAKKAAKRQKLDEEERFSTTKPKNFSDDFLLVTLRAIFEKPCIHAQILKNQRSVYGPAKVKGWKLLESFGVQIITFTTTQLILLVESKYPLTRFTLDQMLNAIRLEVEEESEVSLELLSFGVDAAMDLKKNMLSV
uniref:Xylulose kinase-1 n=1 Tax=Tanacetum cinerariifolium TaxID=118510 RepID=A0A699I5A1_TANCI|nr:hypothetical protein [Tanacetum cinerariifolium]